MTRAIKAVMIITIRLMQAYLITVVIMGTFSFISPEGFTKVNLAVNYIANISLPEEQKVWAKEDIGDFNTLLVSKKGTKPISYKGIRPIFIMDTPQSMLDGNYGIAYYQPFACFIYLNRDSYTDRESFRTLITHEILHCYGYDHSTNPTDVMYPSTAGHDQSGSFFYYASDMIRKKED